MFASKLPYFFIISTKYCIVVVFCIMKNIFYSVGHFQSSFFDRSFYDSDTPKWFHRPFQNFVCLKSNYHFVFLVYVSWFMASDS